jgi:Asp-tRNA(Asn)/Glu-tRNA(Gln) amidotransferase B subunit
LNTAHSNVTPIDHAYQFRVEENAENEVGNSQMDKIADELLAVNEKIVQQVREGKEKALNALVGQMMGRLKKEGITADAALINETLKRKINA